MAPKLAKNQTDRVTVRLPMSQIQQMEALVSAGVYRTTTDLVYNAIKELLLVKGSEAVKTIEAEQGLLKIQQELAKIEQQKRKLGLL